MKKIVKLILPMFMVGLIIYSCTKENEINDIQTIDYEKIGKEHNLGLDFIFNELKKCMSVTTHNFVYLFDI
jgi:hypothetical protein